MFSELKDKIRAIAIMINIENRIVLLYFIGINLYIFLDILVTTYSL